MNGSLSFVYNHMFAASEMEGLIIHVETLGVKLTETNSFLYCRESIHTCQTPWCIQKASCWITRQSDN